MHARAIGRDKVLRKVNDDNKYIPQIPQYAQISPSEEGGRVLVPNSNQYMKVPDPLFSSNW